MLLTEKAALVRAVTTGIEVAGAFVGPSGAFGEGELGNQDRSAFDSGRGVRVEIATIVGRKPSPLMRAPNSSA